MDPIKPKFYQANFQVEYLVERLELKGLVSEQGITKIFIPAAKITPHWKASFGREVTIHLDMLQIQGVLIQQFVEYGTFFEIRFRQIEEPQKQFIRQRISNEGINPGWHRQFPRIPVSGHDDPELPVPNLCLVRFVGQEVFVNVMNFTLGGIRIETMGDALGELRVGSLIHFDLITSTGEILANLSAEVRNISVNEHTDGELKTITRSFGLRFLDLDPVNERKYRNLIRDYCTILQKRFVDKP
jgi:hypothetical protein